MKDADDIGPQSIIHGALSPAFSWKG
jgi:hypothetical protein